MVPIGENNHTFILPNAFRATCLIRRSSKDHKACLGERKMEKNIVDFFLSSGLPLTPHFNVVDVKAATCGT